MRTTSENVRDMLIVMAVNVVALVLAQVAIAVAPEQAAGWVAAQIVVVVSAITWQIVRIVAGRKER